MKYLSIQNLRKTFGETKISFSMEADEGTMTCIVGPSGSGKSTVLRMIAGLCEYDKSDDETLQSKIFLDSKDISNLAPQKRNVGMVFQQPSLFLNLNVLDNIAYGLRSNGWSKKDATEEAHKMLEKIGMENFAHRMSESLSGGEAQRVCLARTLIVKPKLILFDEPLSALDAPMRKRLAEEIISMQKEFKFTSLMVTHDLEEAKRISNRIIVLKSGSIIFDGEPDEFSESLLEQD